MNHPPAIQTSTSWRWIGICAALYSLALSRTINGASLSTDEAFSAYIACHRSIHSLWMTLVGGDSSDLQAWMHYLYLHVWVNAFGSTEPALRSANLPFILLFAIVLVWVSGRVFHSGWLWLLPASLPFLWIFASQVRAYFSLIALGMLFFSTLSAYLWRPTVNERRFLPWVVLGSLFVGTTFHMLMLLTVMPALVLLGALRFRGEGEFHLRDWRMPAIAFSVPFAALACYLLWTFGRGTAYDYSRPTLSGMVSVLLQFAGLSGYRSQQANPAGMTPAFLTLALGLGVLLVGLVALCYTGLRSERHNQFSAIALALILALIQAGIMSFAIHQQFEVRHLAAIIPLFLLLMMAGTARHSAALQRATAQFAFFCLLVCWIGSDYRLLFLPEYRVEDYRGTVSRAIDLQRQEKSDILVLSDPIAPAYYSLDVHGAKPCFPLATTCEAGFERVDWHDTVPAVYGLWWKPEQVEAWLFEHRKRQVHTIVIQTIWHPIYEQSAWWPVLQARQDAVREKQHGFLIYDLP